MATRINRTLYVGLGGTGAKTLVKIKRHFLDAYDDVPIYKYAPTRPIHFGGETINGILFKYAYQINNVNTVGTSFCNLDDLLDDVAKCAFLPSGDMGTTADEMKDNVIANLSNYLIGGKDAWAASVSAAEMIYDSDIMGLATAYGISEQLVGKLMNTNKMGFDLCDNFVDREEVKIRENGGDLHDDVIDAVFPLQTIRPFEVEKETTGDDITNRFNQISTHEEKIAVADYAQKLLATKSKLTDEVSNIIRDTDGGGLSAAVRFPERHGGFRRLLRRRDEDREGRFGVPPERNTRLGQENRKLPRFPRPILERRGGGSQRRDKRQDAHNHGLDQA